MFMCENFLETYAEELYFSCYLQQVPQTMKKVLQLPSFSPLHQSTCVSFLCSFLSFTMQIYSININVDRQVKHHHYLTLYYMTHG